MLLIRRVMLVVCTATLAGCPSPPSDERAPPAAIPAATPAADNDPYAKYEAMESPEIKSWANAETAKTRDYIDGLSSRASFHTAIAKGFDVATVGVPVKSDAGYLYERKLPGEKKHVLVRATLVGQDEVVLLDPNEPDAEGRWSLANWVLSHSERHLAFAVTRGGSDWRSWRVLDLSTGTLLPDELRGQKWAPPAWAPNDVGLFYSGYPDRSQSEHAKAIGNRVYYHALGTEQSADISVYQPENEKFATFVSVSEAHDVMTISVQKSSGGRLRMHPFALPSDWHADLAKTFSNPDAHVQNPDFAWRQGLVGVHEGALFIHSHRDAKRGRIDRYGLGDEAPTTIVSEREHALVDVSLVGGRLFAEYAEDVKSVVVVFDPSGKQVDEIRRPQPSGIDGFTDGRADHDEALFTAQAYGDPPSIYRYRISDGETERLWRSPIPFEPEHYTSTQRFYSSGDAKKVPLFVVHRKDVALDAKRPTLLLGYGCYGRINAIKFRNSVVPWLEKGGVFAVANIRGGGAYGVDWHEAGKHANKQHAVDDFIAAAEYLQREKYTAPEHLIINGYSCGGLVAAATAMQRPDLMAGAILEMGIYDLLRYSAFSSAHMWTDEIGDPEEPADRPHLKMLSPLLAAQERRRYPAVLINTRMKDTRVVPMNSYKLAAALQQHQTGPAPVLLRVDETGGHKTALMPTTMQIEYHADKYAFAWEAAQ